MSKMSHFMCGFACLSLTVLTSVASAQGSMSPVSMPTAQERTVRTFVVTTSVPQVVSAAATVAAAPTPTNETQRLELEQATLVAKLNTLRSQAIGARQQLIQGNAGLTARQKKIDALSAELEQLRQAQQKELQAVETASASPLAAEYARITARLQVIHQTLSAQSATVEPAHP